MLMKYFLFVIAGVAPNVCAKLFPRATPRFFNTTSTTSSSISSTHSHEESSSTSSRSSTSSLPDHVAPNPGFPNPNLSALSTTNHSSTKTTSAAGNSTTPAVCCFLVQDTVDEEYWNISSFSSTFSVVNVTKLTTHMTVWPSLTTSSIETHIHLTNHSFLFSFPVGVNPITNFVNNAPRPTEVAHSHNGTALVTGGVTIPSPAAFYVYSTVKVITASQVTDELGNLACATPSGDFDVNQYAEAYFGGGADIVGYASSIANSRVATETHSYTYFTDDGTSKRPTSSETITGVYTYNNFETFFTDSYGSRVEPGPPPSGVVISLTTPFIYQPERGKLGATSATGLCGQRNAQKEDFGYVPKVFFDHLLENEGYSTQYPGLESCFLGGPSIWTSECAGFTITTTKTIGSDTLTITSVVTAPGAPPGYQTASGTDLTEETIIYAGTPSVGGSRPTDPPKPPISAGPVAPPETKTAIIQPPNSPKPSQQPPVTQPPVNPPQPPQSNAFPAAPVRSSPAKPSPLGSIINSIFGGPPNPPNKPSENPPSDPVHTNALPANPQPRPIPAPNVIIPSPTTIPVNAAPPGLGGKTTEINGQTFVVVPRPTTFAAIIPSPGVIPGAGATIIDGSPFIVITSSTKIPVVNAPSGLTGDITTIDNTAFVIVPEATTIAALPPHPVGPLPAFGASTTIIDGITFVAINGPTNIPVVGAPPGLTGSLTVIDNTPFIIVPGATNIPVPDTGAGGSTLGRTTIIDGTPLLFIPGPTTIPLANAPSGLTGTTTTISGTAFIVVPGPTNIPLPAGSGSNLGTTTMINGTPFLVIPSATTIALSLTPSGVVGSTTTIDGTPFLIIPSSTIIPLPDPAQIPVATTTIINGTPFLIIPSATSIPLSLLPTNLPRSTTIINGTPFLIIPSPTTLAIPNTAQTSLPGPLTVIDGTTELILTGPTTIPVNPNFSISGSTTVVDGTTMVIISGATTIPIHTGPLTTGVKSTSSHGSKHSSSASKRTSSGSDTSTSLPSTTLVAPAASTSAKKNGARPGHKTDEKFMFGLGIGVLVALIPL